MKKFCIYGIGTVAAVILYFWFVWDLWPNWVTPFGKLEVQDPEAGGVKFVMVLFPYIVAVCSWLGGLAVGGIVYCFYRLLDFLAHCWVKKVDGKPQLNH